MLIRYVLAMIAGIWMADGLALVLAPRHVITQVQDMLAIAPKIASWEGLAAGFGVCLLVGTRGLHYEMLWTMTGTAMGTRGLHYEMLWTMTGTAMVLKGVFLMMGPKPWRQRVLEWCLRREDIDYRFWGLGLCTLSVLLLHASGWIGTG